jgi:hypothetical protein
MTDPVDQFSKQQAERRGVYDGISLMYARDLQAQAARFARFYTGEPRIKPVLPLTEADTLRYLKSMEERGLAPSTIVSRLGHLSVFIEYLDETVGSPKKLVNEYRRKYERLK